MTEPTLTLDIGGTKIAAGLVGADGELRATERRPMPRGTDPEAAFAVVGELVRTLSAAHALRGVGIGSAGPVELRAGTVSPVNVPAWRGFPIRDRVAALVPGLPVHLAGDGLCMALGEYWHGAGRGAASVLGMVVSTGIGGGLILDGRPYSGRTGNAGHVGHVVVDPYGPVCACGGRGCVEAVASGPRMVQWARENGWQAPDSADARVLSQAAESGDAVALRAFARGARAIAAMIASVAAVCDLDRVVIGGGVAKSGALLFEPVRAALADHARLDFISGLQVHSAQLGGDAGLIGAARLLDA